MPKPFWLAAVLWLPLVSTQVSAQSTPWETSTAAGSEAYQQGSAGQSGSLALGFSGVIIIDRPPSLRGRKRDS